MSSEAFRQFLLMRGYGDWWLASHNCKWGVRSRFRGAQLHFRGGSQLHFRGFQQDATRVNVHIDINNPGDPVTPGGSATGCAKELPAAIRHLLEDDHRRGVTHVPAKLRAALEAGRISIPRQVP